MPPENNQVLAFVRPDTHGTIAMAFFFIARGLGQWKTTSSLPLASMAHEVAKQEAQLPLYHILHRVTASPTEFTAMCPKESTVTRCSSGRNDMSIHVTVSP